MDKPGRGRAEIETRDRQTPPAPLSVSQLLLLQSRLWADCPLSPEAILPVFQIEGPRSWSWAHGCPGGDISQQPLQAQGVWVEESMQFRATSFQREVASLLLPFTSPCSPRGLEQGHHGGDTAPIVSSSGSQPEAILFPVGHVEMSGDIFHCHSREAVARSIECIEATAAVKRPVMH